MPNCWASSTNAGRGLGADRRTGADTRSRRRPGAGGVRTAAYRYFADRLTRRPEADADHVFRGARRQSPAPRSALPVAGLHIDLVASARTAGCSAGRRSRGPQILSLGIIDGRNIWKADLDDDPRSDLEPARRRRAARVHGRAVLLATPHTDRSGAGEQARSGRYEVVARLRRAEDRGIGDSSPRL